MHCANDAAATVALHLTQGRPLHLQVKVAHALELRELHFEQAFAAGNAKLVAPQNNKTCSPSVPSLSDRAPRFPFESGGHNDVE